MTLQQVLKSPRKMGHAFILALILEAFDKRQENKVASKQRCYFCKKDNGTFTPVIFYKGTLKVSCKKCSKNIEDN